MLRQEGESIDVRGTHDAEVPPVKRRDRRHVQPFGCGDHGRIDGSQAKIGVSSDKFRGSGPIGVGGLDDQKRSGGQIRQEMRFGPSMKPPGQQLRHLRDNKDWEVDGPLVASEESAAVGVSGVGCIQQSVNGPRVGDQGSSPILWR